LPASQQRKRGARVKKTSSTGKISQIEDKLDDLVSLLRAQSSKLSDSPSDTTEGAAQNRPEPEGSPPASPHFPPGHFAAVWLPKDKEGIDSSNAPEFNPGYCPSFRSILADTPADGNNAQIAPSSPTTSEHFEENPDRDFEIFKARHLKGYPFMYIPASMTAEEFQQTNPFLWMNIDAIFSSSLRRRGERGQKIREHLAQKVVVQGERSLELLQGTLMHGAW
jgi:hypothetical protein